MKIAKELLSPIFHTSSGSQGLRNVFSAREFVWWYNGHPDCRDLPVDLSEVQYLPWCMVHERCAERVAAGELCFGAVHTGCCVLWHAYRGSDQLC